MAGQEIYCAGTQQQNNKKLRMYGFYLQFQDNLSGRTRNLLCRDPAAVGCTVSIYNFRTTGVAGQEIYCAGTQQQNNKKLRMYGFYLQFQDNLSGRTRKLLCRDPATESQET